MCYKYDFQYISFDELTGNNYAPLAFYLSCLVGWLGHSLAPLIPCDPAVRYKIKEVNNVKKKTHVTFSSIIIKVVQRVISSTVSVWISFRSHAISIRFLF